MARSEIHNFNSNVAQILSIQKAIILKDLFYWVKSNLQKRHNFHDGAYWTYNPARAYAEKYPYMNQKSISRWISELEKDGWIFSRDLYNKRKGDRTKWHTVNLIRYVMAENGKIQNKKDVDLWVKSVNENTISQNENWYKTFPQNETPISQNEKYLSSQNETALPITYQLPTAKEKINKKDFEFDCLETSDQNFDEGIKEKFEKEKENFIKQLQSD